MKLLNWLSHMLSDDVTKAPSVTRVVLLISTVSLSFCLVYALFAYAHGGREGWPTVVNYLGICLSATLTGYAAKVVSCAIKGKQDDE